MRRIAHDRIQRIADQVQDWCPDRASAEFAAQVLDQGREDEQRRVRVRLLRARIESSRPLTPKKKIAIEYWYDWMQALCSGIQRANRSELTLLAATVAPDYGKKPARTWKEWSTSDEFLRLFDVNFGNEVQLIAPTGTGKTTLEGNFTVAWLKFNPHFRAVHNINAFKIHDPELDARARRCTYMSEALGYWADLDEDNVILFQWDEPNVTLHTKAGQPKDVELLNKVRSQLRKMGWVLVYGWQVEKQIFPMLRDPIAKGPNGQPAMEDPTIPRIDKPNKTSMVVWESVNDQVVKTVVEDLPGPEEFSFESKGLTAFEFDVDWPKFLSALKKYPTLQEAKVRVKEMLRDPSFYRPEFLAEHGFEAEVKEERRDRQAEIIDEVLACMCSDNPEQAKKFRLARGGVNAILVREAYGPDSDEPNPITFRNAQVIKARVEAELDEIAKWNA